MAIDLTHRRPVVGGCVAAESAPPPPPPPAPRPPPPAPRFQPLLTAAHWAWGHSPTAVGCPPPAAEQGAHTLRAGTP